ncbi:MAG: hypothetical protein LBG64_01710 [Pseudomonadales bacterium]|jgi:hypothetical protein|nr:hypothetical protein [Pseudomonadales bacterium]
MQYALKNIFSDKWIVFLLALQLIVLTIYAWFSFGLVTPNLILFNNATYFEWQTQMWNTFHDNRTLTAQVYAILISVSFIIYFFLIQKLLPKLKKNQLAFKHVLFILLLSSFPLFFSYNSLSADVFNYIFNARMVVHYGANPHVQVAMDFPDDPMVRFMHNSHTYAPYGYGFTLLSLPFYLIGFDRFILQWFSMRVFAVLGLILTYLVIWKWWHHKSKFKNENTFHPFWLFLNPLMLIEFISNSHNDVWMILPAMLSLFLIYKSKRTWKVVLISLLLIAFSISVKYATLVLVPFWLYIVLEKPVVLWLKQTKIFKVFLKWFDAYFFDIIALGMFVPLLTPRSQLFHPWYLSWSIVWLPFCKSKIVPIFLLAFSASAMLRYLPFLLAGNYEGSVLIASQLITFVGAIVIVGVYYLVKYFCKTFPRVKRG